MKETELGCKIDKWKGNNMIEYFKIIYSILIVPIINTLFEDKTVYLWNATTYRYHVLWLIYDWQSIYCLLALSLQKFDQCILWVLSNLFINIGAPTSFISAFAGLIMNLWLISRLEKALNFGLEWVWGVGYMKGSKQQVSCLFSQEII